MADSSLIHKLGAIISSPENRSKITVILLMEAAAQLGESAIFEYIVVQELSNTKLFTCEVKVGRVLKCHGRGPNKRTAKAKAAENALKMIREMTGLRRYSPQVSTWQGQDTPKTEKVNVLEEDLKLAGKSKKPMDLEVSTAKDVKKKKHKLRFKDMDKRSSEKGNDLMEAYTEKPFQEEIPDDRQTPQPQPEFKEAVEDVLSEDETWEDKEDSWFPELDEVADKAKLTYGRDFLLQLQTHPISMLRPEGLPDSEVFLGQARTPSRSTYHQTTIGDIIS